MTRASRKPGKRSREERVEEALRPSAGLGYDRDALALHLIEKEMFSLAEGQLRQAIRLNPFEAGFKLHLAYCFYRQGRYPEAHEWAQQALAQKEDAHARELLGLIETALNAG
jgi:tetratricopeptide (TPR) repeat protein